MTTTSSTSPMLLGLAKSAPTGDSALKRGGAFLEIWAVSCMDRGPPRLPSHNILYYGRGRKPTPRAVSLRSLAYRTLDLVLKDLHVRSRTFVQIPLDCITERQETWIDGRQGARADRRREHDRGRR